MDSNQFDMGGDAFGLKNDVEEAEHKPKGEATTFIEEDEEERALIEAARRDQEERLRALREKEEQEMKDKRERKAQAQKELNEWYEKKNKKIDSKRRQNEDEELTFIRTREQHNKSKNPWEKILDNVEIDPKRAEGITMKFIAYLN
jgi:flagellar motility protein MotE (MotC chaperone)